MIMVPDTTSGLSSLGKVVPTRLHADFAPAVGLTHGLLTVQVLDPDLQDSLSGDVITDSRGNKKRFNTLGQMIEMELATGDKTTFNYLTDGSIQRITDPRGQQTNYRTYLPGANNTKRSCSSRQTNWAAMTQTMTFCGLPVTSGGSLTITYDDPDGTVPRLARQDLVTYNRHGLINTLRSGDIDSLTQITRIDCRFGLTTGVVSLDAPFGCTTIPTIIAVSSSSHLLATKVSLLHWEPAPISQFLIHEPFEFRQVHRMNNYSVIQESNELVGANALATSVYQFDLDVDGWCVYWDAEQIESLGIASTLTVLSGNESLGISSSAANTLVANRYRSWEYNRQSTQRNSFGTVIGNDWGEVLSTVAPQTSSGRQTITWSYSNNHPTSQQMPRAKRQSLTWNNTFGVLTSRLISTRTSLIKVSIALEESPVKHGAKVPRSGRIPIGTSMSDNDGNLTPSDVLAIINLLNAGGGGPVPQALPLLHLFTTSTVTTRSRL